MVCDCVRECGGRNREQKCSILHSSSMEVLRSPIPEHMDIIFSDIFHFMSSVPCS